ncbi:putative short-chain dehydrogenase/reductase [Jackrogersella minutella]|nr:putative short-chain dehydrogenase/reductase [Jackrogersella minutella]
MPKKIVLITGCSVGGLGFALAKAFQQAGCHVLATARNPNKVGSLADEPDIEILSLDVTSEDSIASCMSEVHKKTNGRLDILVNNAGNSFLGPLMHAPIAEGKAMYDVNVWGALAVTQAFAPLLIQAKGTMLNISSMAGSNYMAWQGVYNSSKAAMTFLSETWKLELEPLGVRVVTAMVGAVRTQIYAHNKMVLPQNSYYKPIEDIIGKQARGELQEPFNEPPDVTARNIVRDTLSGRRGKIWRGGEAGAASVGSWLLPTSFLEWFLHQKRGLYELRQFYKNK